MLLLRDVVISIVFGAMLFIANPAQAEDNRNAVHIQYAFRDTVASSADNPNRQGVNFTFSRKVLNQVTWDVNNQFRSENGSAGHESNRLETGLAYQTPIAKDVVFYTRGAIGYKFTDNLDNTYYSIEPGVKVQLTSPLNVRVGYRYRDSFNDQINDQTNTVRLGAEYALDKTQTLTFGVDRAWQDSEFVGYHAGYAVKF